MAIEEADKAGRVPLLPLSTLERPKDTHGCTPAGTWHLKSYPLHRVTVLAPLLIVPANAGIQTIKVPFAFFALLYRILLFL